MRYQVTIQTDDEAAAREAFRKATADKRNDHIILWQATNPALPGMIVAIDEATNIALHFVGFSDSDQYHRAQRVFGPPDFVHRTWDVRAQQEVMPNDVAIFAKYDPADTPCVYAFDDSNQPNDPAAQERKQ